MDKGYDSEEIHELIQDTLNSCSLIPVRNRKRNRISGYYRRRLAQSFDEEKYHQRNKVETVFFILKRKFRDSLKARKFRLQVKEIKIKVILYNLSRMISTFLFLILFEEFYKANSDQIKVRLILIWGSTLSNPSIHINEIFCIISPSITAQCSQMSILTIHLAFLRVLIEPD